MTREAVVAGTEFSNSNGEVRASIIRSHCETGAPIVLRRLPDKYQHENAIAVYLKVPRAFGLLGTSLKQIGYIEAGEAVDLAKRMDGGQPVAAHVHRFFAPLDRRHPRVHLHIEY